MTRGPSTHCPPPVSTKQLLGANRAEEGPTKLPHPQELDGGLAGTAVPARLPAGGRACVLGLPLRRPLGCRPWVLHTGRGG